MDFTVFFLVFKSSINNLGHAYKWQNVLVCACSNFFSVVLLDLRICFIMSMANGKY